MSNNYVSNIPHFGLESAFPHSREIALPTLHRVLCDPDYEPGCGYATADEAAILGSLASAYPGHWLEIGAHVGWTAAHILKANGTNTLISVDSAFVTSRLDRFKDNLKRAGVLDRSSQVALTSAEYLMGDVAFKFDGIFIDGNHDDPWPAVDAILSLKYLNQGGVIVFHDGVGRPIRCGVHYLSKQGMEVKMYNTPQKLTACSFIDKFVQHMPDPKVNWGSWSHQVDTEEELDAGVERAQSALSQL